MGEAATCSTCSTGSSCSTVAGAATEAAAVFGTRVGVFVVRVVAEPGAGVFGEVVLEVDDRDPRVVVLVTTAAAAVFAVPLAGRRLVVRAGAFGGPDSSSLALSAISSPVCCAPEPVTFEAVFRDRGAAFLAALFDASAAGASRASVDSGLSDDERSKLTPLPYQAVRGRGYRRDHPAKSEPRKVL
jgi:hypothetical protein